MKILVGLGNPGKKYQPTPHNIGFEVVDCLARRWRGSFSMQSRERAELAEAQIEGERVILAKPMTFMNLSGEAVRAIMQNRPVEMPDVLAIMDEVQLELGRVRMRGEGSAGGHNGLRSVIECLGGEGFARLRVGVRPPQAYEDLAEYVLSKPRPEIREALEHMKEIAADAAEFWVRNGTETTANRFNGYRMAETS